LSQLTVSESKFGCNLQAQPIRLIITHSDTAETVEGSDRVVVATVPFPDSRVSEVAELSLRSEDDTEIAYDFRVSERWPCGALRWVRFAWLGSGSLSHHLSIGNASVSPAVQGEALVPNALPPVVKPLPHSGRDCVQVDDVTASLDVVLHGGTPLRSTTQTQNVDWCGEVATERLFQGVGSDPGGTGVLAWATNVTTYSHDRVQRWALTLRNPKAASHPGGVWELGDANACLIRSAQIGLLRHRDVTATTGASASGSKVISRLAVSDRWKSTQGDWKLSQLGSGGQNYRSPIHRDRSGSVHAPHRGYQLVDQNGTVEGDRATPSVIREFDDGSAIGIHVPRFWQNFPKAIGFDGDQITLEIFPEDFGAAHELQPGEQTTVEFWVATGTVDEVKRRIETIIDGPQPRVDALSVCRSGAIPWLTPRDSDLSMEYAAYLALVDQAVAGGDSFFHKREKIGQYGWRNFGDLYADHESVYSDSDNPMVSHYNNQYDVIFGFGVHYLQGGDPKFLELMNDLARHVIDIDIYHTDEDRAAYNHGLFWHTTHYVDAGLSTHRSYPRGTCGGGPSSGHAYSRGLLLYYCMTGDPTAYEAVVKMGEWMIAAEDGSKTKYRWLTGGETGLTSASGNESYHGPGRGPGNAVEVLLNAFELTHERRFLEQAERLIRRVVHPDQDIASLDLLDVENKWFYLIFLQALGRYLEVKISMNEIDMMYAYGKATLLRYADWMAENEEPFLTHPEKLEYPNETWAAQDIRKTEVFQWAARHADAQRRSKFLERAGWFFKHAIEELNQFETKSLCRPVALLLTNGYSYEFFRRGGLDTIPESPAAPEVEFPAPQVFRSQKSRAIRNAKRLVVGSTLAFGLLTASGILIWLAR
jgi:hypothetical protein